MLDTGFILGDPRLDGLTLAARWLYIVLWVSCVKERRSTLSRHHLAPGSLARRAGLDHRSIRPALAQLQQICLIDVDPEKGITVYGVKGKHPNLKWKDDRINESMPRINESMPGRVSRVEKEKEKEVEAARGKPVDNSPGSVDAEKRDFPLSSLHLPLRKKPTSTQTAILRIAAGYFTPDDLAAKLDRCGVGTKDDNHKEGKFYKILLSDLGKVARGDDRLLLKALAKTGKARAK